MKGGFTMNDLRGLNRNFNEDGVEADEQMLRLNPSRPTRKTSVSRGSPTYDGYETGSKMQRSTSALDIDGYQDGMDDKSEKKRGRSPFKFFKKSRDQSKDKHKSRSPTDRNRGRGTCKYLRFRFTTFNYHFVQIFGNFVNISLKNSERCLEHCLRSVFQGFFL